MVTPAATVDPGDTSLDPANLGRPGALSTPCATQSPTQDGHALSANLFLSPPAGSLTELPTSMATSLNPVKPQVTIQKSIKEWYLLPTIPEEDPVFAIAPTATPSTEELHQARALLRTRRRPVPKPSNPTPEDGPPDPLATRLRHWLVSPTPTAPPSDHPSLRHQGLAPDLSDND